MTGNPFILAIAGGSGAGKTTLAATLVAELASLRTVIISEDHYYRDNAASPGFDPDTFNFDAPETRDHPLLARHLGRLRAGLAIDMPLYDFYRHRRLEGTSHVTPGDLVIVEGNLVLHDSNVRQECDHRVYLDAPDDLRLQRRIQRDVVERGRTVASVLHQFEATVRPMHDRYVHPTRLHADRIVAWDDEGLVTALVRLIDVSRAERVTIDR